MDRFSKVITDKSFNEKLMIRCLNFSNGNKELAQDLFSSTILKAWEKRDTFLKKNDEEFLEEDFQKWTFTICRNHFFDQNKKDHFFFKKNKVHPLNKKQEDKVKRVTYSDKELDNTSLGLQDFVETQMDFENCLQELSEKEREAILNNLENKTYKEISEMMKITLSDLRTSISRARDKLMICMEVAI